MKSLKDLLTSARIRSLADLATIKRGQDYYARGQIQSVTRTLSGIRAYILGQRMYNVELTAVANNLDHHCTCPMGQQGDFCKHCVALAVFFLNQPPPEDAFPIEELRAQLTAEPHERLVELILEWAAVNEQLQDRLYEYQALLAGPDAALTPLRHALLHALRQPHDDLFNYAETVHMALDPIEALLPSAPAAILEICEEAAQAIVPASKSTYIDDDDIAVLEGRIEDIHREAARLAKPNPVQFATRLFRLETTSPIRLFQNAAEIYKDVLGPTGLTTYRDLTENATFTRPADRDRILESIARATGRLEDLIDVHARDLSAPHRFERIVALCLQAENHPLALTWAERGHKLYPASMELRVMLANEYNHLGRQEDAVKLIWKSFTESPGLPLYRVLQRYAEQANDWPEHRDRALGLIRSKIAASKGKQDHSALVEILLAEGNPEDAWREAQAAGCASYLWLQLAEALENSNPAAAVPIFLRRADEELARVKNSNYETPIALLLRAAKLMKKIGALPHFHRHLDALRHQHKSKRRFIELLNQNQARLESQS